MYLVLTTTSPGAKSPHHYALRGVTTRAGASIAPVKFSGREPLAPWIPLAENTDQTCIGLYVSARRSPEVLRAVRAEILHWDGAGLAVSARLEAKPLAGFSVIERGAVGGRVLAPTGAGERRADKMPIWKECVLQEVNADESRQCVLDRLSVLTAPNDIPTISRAVESMPTAVILKIVEEEEADKRQLKDSILAADEILRQLAAAK